MILSYVMIQIILLVDICSLSCLMEGCLNDTCQPLVYSDDNMLIQTIPTLKRNTEALVAGSKEMCLEINADKTKYMVMSRDQNAGRIHNMKIDNRSFERVEDFKYLGTALTHQNSIQEEIKSRLKSGSACYHSGPNLLSSRLLYKEQDIQNQTLPVVLYGC